MRIHSRLLTYSLAFSWGIFGSCQIAPAQVFLTLTPGTGNPVTSASVSLSFGVNNAPPAALQWTIVYPSSDLTVITAASGGIPTVLGKTLSCASGPGAFTCVLSGLNRNSLSVGVVANIQLTPAAGVSTPSLSLSNIVAVDPNGTGLPASLPMPLAILTSVLPNAEVGQPYGPLLMAASGGAGIVTWSVTGLPAGLSLSGKGALSGTPTVTGRFPVVLTVTDSAGDTASTTILLTVTYPPLSITTTSLPSGVRGQLYGVSMNATGGSGSYTWSATGLPSGMTLSSSGGLTGTPTVSGTFSVTIAVSSGGSTASAMLSLVIAAVPAGPPSINLGGVVPLYSTVNAIEPGQWISIYGTNLASSAVTWNGDFPSSLGGTSVTINGKPGYLLFVSPTQINLQAPSDTATGSVAVVVTTAVGIARSTVTLSGFAPSFSLLDSQHVAGIIVRSDGSGAYGGGTYDILGPTGNSLGYPTVAAKAGDIVELFAIGLGPTDPTAPAGETFSGAAATTSPVGLLINNGNVVPGFTGLVSAGLYQINLQVPAGLGTGDVPLVATVGGLQTQSGVVVSLQ